MCKEILTISAELAEVLAKLKWIRYMRFACDTLSQLDAIDIDDAAQRVEHLKQYHNINLFAQAERNQAKGIVPNARQLEFAQRFVHKGMYKHESWVQYLERYRGVERLWKGFES